MREEGHRLEAVVAGPASPEIGHAARFSLDPFRNGDRFAALSAGISPRQRAEICSGHGASPFFFSFKSKDEMDRIAVGYRRSDPSIFELASLKEQWGISTAMNVSRTRCSVLTMHRRAGT